jgi:hypothetical protein
LNGSARTIRGNGDWSGSDNRSTILDHAVHVWDRSRHLGSASEPDKDCAARWHSAAFFAHSAAFIIVDPTTNYGARHADSRTLGDQVNCGRFAHGAEVMPVVHSTLSRYPPAFAAQRFRQLGDVCRDAQLGTAQWGILNVGAKIPSRRLPAAYITATGPRIGCSCSCQHGERWMVEDQDLDSKLVCLAGAESGRLCQRCPTALARLSRYDSRMLPLRKRR